MADERIEVDVVVNSDGADKLNDISKSLNNLGDSASTTGSKMSGGTNSLRDFVNTFSSINNQLNRASRQLSWSLSGFDRVLRNGFKKASSEIKTFVKESLDAYKELSEQHAKTTGAMYNNYDTSTNSGKVQFAQDSDALQKQAIKMAKGTNGDNDIRGSLYTPVDVSNAQTELVKAGVPTKDILNTDVLKTVMEFAQANDLTTENAVKFAVSLGSQFNFQYKDWGSMLDMVSHTADLSTIDVKDVVNSMKYAGGITSGLNRPIEEVLALIAELGQFGLYGSQSGSSIQALYTRLLTQDTTVITDAQKEVAPPKALKAFYDFSKYAKSDGTDIKYEDVKNAKTYKDLKNLGNGNLKPMDEVIDELDKVMSELNDEEQAWFAKKFFGLYQMKGAYALISGNDSDLSITDYETKIKEESDGTNENKLNQLLDSQYGKNLSFSSLIETTKTDIGMKLSPVVNAIRDELFRYIADEGNYDINFDNIRYALDGVSEEIEKQYGNAIGNIVNKIGSMTIDLTEVGADLGPTIMEGLNKIIGKILDGDIPGVFEEWNNMLKELDISVDDLPKDLQDLGDKVVGLIEVFGALTALDIGAKIIDAVTSVVKVIQIMGGAVIKAGSVIVNGGTGGTSGGTGGTGSGGTVINNESGGSSSSSTSKGGKFVSGLGNVAKFAVSLAAGYGGAQLGGNLGDNIESFITGDENTSGIGNTIGSVAGGIAGYELCSKLGSKAISAIGKGLSASWNSGALKTARMYGMYGADALGEALSSEALVGGTAGSSAAAVAGSLALPATVVVGTGLALYEGAKAEKEKDKNRQDIADVHADGDTELYDKNGDLMRKEDGTLFTENDIWDFADEQKRLHEDNKYKFGYGGTEQSYEEAKPESTIRWYNPFSWGNGDDDEKKLKEWEDKQKKAEEDKKKRENSFNEIQDYMYNTTGIIMSYKDFISNKPDTMNNVSDDIEKNKFNNIGNYDLTDEFKKKFTIGTDEWAKSYIDQVNEGIISQGYTITDDKGKRNLTIENSKANRKKLKDSIGVYEDKIDGPIQIMTNILSKELVKTDQYKKQQRDNGNVGSNLTSESIRSILGGSSDKSDTNNTNTNNDVVKDTQKTQKNIQVVDKSNINITPTTTPVMVQPNLNIDVSVDSFGAIKKMTPSQLGQLANIVTQYNVNKSKSYNTDGKSK